MERPIEYDDLKADASQIKAKEPDFSQKVKEITLQVNKDLKLDKPVLEQAREVQKIMMTRLRDKLFERQENGNTYYENYLSKYLAEALADPNSRAGQSLASGLINEKMFLQMDAIAAEERSREYDLREYRVRKTLYDKQQEVFDNNIDKFILIINSRRSGKTELMGRLIAKRVIRPNQHVCYINRSADAAARQISGPLNASLKAAGFTEADIHGKPEGGRVDLSNGSWVLIIGNNNIKDVDKLRGEKLGLVILDEVAHQRNMRHLITEVIQPATIDYEDSQIVAVGTPPRTAHTFVEELWDNPRVKKYHWTFEDNPFIPNKENVVKEVCELHGVDPESAFIQREYYGRMDAYDNDAMLIKRYDIWDHPWVGSDVKSNFNYGQPMTGNKLAPERYDYAWIGVDWGFEDKAAVVSIVANVKYRRAWIVDCWSKSKTPIKEVAEEVLRQKQFLESTYHPSHAVQIICDTNDKQGIAELYSTYNIHNVYGAWKYDKDLALDQLSDMFYSGVFSIANKSKIEPRESTIKENDKIRIIENPAHAIIDDCEMTIWKRDEETDKVLHEIDDNIHHPNALMAVLYVSRQFCYDVLGDHETHKVAKAFATQDNTFVYTKEEQAVMGLKKEGII